VENVENLIKKTNSKDTVENMDNFFQKIASLPPSEILYRGRPWGGLEEMKNGVKLAPGYFITY